MKQYDVLIIGAGIAGLYASINLPKSMNVLVVCKDVPWECNTFYAQGGMVTTLNTKDIISHIDDTIKAGKYHNDREAVEIMSNNSKSVTDDIISKGMEFDKNSDGSISYTQEAAHSAKRIIHAGGDATGRYMHHFLMSKNNHKLQRNTLVYDLLIRDGRCYGVKASVNYRPVTIFAKHIIIASGGIGSLYEYNTNSRTVSSDIHGICVEKGIELEDMEMMQFHPTVFVNSPYARKLLLTEALRGEGAFVVNSRGKRILFDYDSRGELASRDIVSRAIFNYKKDNIDDEVYLDFSIFDKKFFTNRFPNITKTFASIGYNLPYDRIPISPAFHYAVGGIKSQLDGSVEGIESLYVIGEASRTGVHGANRLASNSLLEGLVFSKIVTNTILSKEQNSIKIPYFDKDYSNILHKDNDKKYKHKLRKIMWEDVGIIRTKKGLLKAKNAIYDLKSRDIGRLLELRLNTATSIINSALWRKESLGTHYRES